MYSLNQFSICAVIALTSNHNNKIYALACVSYSRKLRTSILNQVVSFKKIKKQLPWHGCLLFYIYPIFVTESHALRNEVIVIVFAGYSISRNDTTNAGPIIVAGLRSSKSYELEYSKQYVIISENVIHLNLLNKIDPANVPIIFIQWTKYFH